MRVLVVGDGAAADAASEGLEAAGLAVERRAGDAPAGEPSAEIGAIARDLREMEATLGDAGPDVVLVASSSPAALAAVLVATKLGTPVARLEDSGGAGDEGANAQLIGQLADTTLAAGTQAIVAWVRDSYAPRA